MLKITPGIILFPLKLGGSIHGVPMPISERKRYTYAVKGITKAIRDRDGRLTVVTVAEALVGALYGRGIAIDKRNAVNRTALANRYMVRFLTHRRR